MTGETYECKLGSDPGWRFEGRYSYLRREQKHTDARVWQDYEYSWSILAVGARRGDYEVGALFFLKNGVDLPIARESALTLRILDAREMTKKRAELEAKVKKSGGEDEAWIVRVRAKIPAGWRYLRRGDTVYIYPDGIPSSTVETMAIRLDTMRKRVYAKAFPADEDKDRAPAVVKVTRDERQYLSYGAPKGSLGYFSARERELVLFYQAADWWDRIDSTAVLFHEGFHQYVDQALDGLDAHPWFEEGFGDYYGGWRLFEGNPRPGELTARKSAMEDILHDGAMLDTAALLRMEWAAFYGRGENAVSPGIAYAQSWSLVTFLRSGKHSACVDRYWAALRESARKWKAREATAAIQEERPVRPAGAMPEAEAVEIRKAALEEGFRGVDLFAIDRVWFEWALR